MRQNSGCAYCSPASIIGIIKQGPGVRDRKAEIRAQSSEIGDQASAIENQKSEDKRPVIKTEQNTPSEQPVIRPEHRKIRSKNIQNSPNVMKTKHPQNNIMLDALQVLQDGLKSMQALQKQTAETHQSRPPKPIKSSWKPKPRRQKPFSI